MTMIAPNLDPLQGATVNRAILYFLGRGYRPVTPTSGCRIFRDRGATHLVHLSAFPALASAFSKACLNAPENPHLPKMLGERTLGQSLHIRITENLHTCEDFPAEARRTVCGLVRAFSSLFEGDTIHMNVHPMLRQDENLLDAVRSIVACGEALTNPVCADAAVPVRIEHRGHSVLFRADSNEPVFASPLVPANESLKATYQRLQLVKTRFSDAEMTLSASRYWPRIPTLRAA